MDIKVYHPVRQRRLKTSSSMEQMMKKKPDSKSKEISTKKKFEAGNVKENPCANANCSTLCLLSPIAPYYKCVCPDNFNLGSDTKSCVSNCSAAQILCKKSMKCIPFFRSFKKQQFDICYSELSNAMSKLQRCLFAHK